MDRRRIRRAYDELAPWFDALEFLPDRLLGTRRARRRLLARARGRVLEVAAGTGRNLAHYPPGARVTAVDASRGMLEEHRARLRGSETGSVPPVSLARMDGERLAFPDRSFDTVVDTLALCTFLRPVRALREMARVCRPEGRILLLEHGRSEVAWIARLQDRFEWVLADRVGCHWNRSPLELVREAGLRVRGARRFGLGVFHSIEAAPGGGGPAAGTGSASGPPPGTRGESDRDPG